MTTASGCAIQLCYFASILPATTMSVWVVVSWVFRFDQLHSQQLFSQYTLVQFTSTPSSRMPPRSHTYNREDDTNHYQSEEKSISGHRITICVHNGIKCLPYLMRNSPCKRGALDV
jgi:hypothetical protein